MTKLRSLITNFLQWVKAIAIVLGYIIIDISAFVFLVIIFYIYRLVGSLVWWVNIQSWRVFNGKRIAFVEKRKVKKAWETYKKK